MNDRKLQCFLQCRGHEALFARHIFHFSPATGGFPSISQWLEPEICEIFMLQWRSIKSSDRLASQRKQQTKNIREISPFLTLNSPLPITSKSLKSPKSSIACDEPLLRDENLAETLEKFNLSLNLFEQAPRVVHQMSPDSTPPPEIYTFESGSNGFMLSIVRFENDDLKSILFYVFCVTDKKLYRND